MRPAPGVSVVEMNAGGDPYEIGGESFGEFAGETADDSIFTTPAGHQNVTFVAAGGDNTSGNSIPTVTTGTATFASVSSPIDFPASSPNVLSVGGTALTTSSDGGDYGSESSWSGNTDGPSRPMKPSQISVRSSEFRQRRAKCRTCHLMRATMCSASPAAMERRITMSITPTLFWFVGTNWGTLEGTTARFRPGSRAGAGCTRSPTRAAWPEACPRSTA